MVSTCARASTKCSTAHTGWGRCAGQPAVIIHLVRVRVGVRVGGRIGVEVRVRVGVRGGVKMQ